MEDLNCEGEYFGDPILKQSSLVRINLGASSKRESMRDTSVEPSSSIGNHINWDFELIEIKFIVGVAVDSTRPRNRLRERVPLQVIFKKICSSY